LMGPVPCHPAPQTLHVGDRFTLSGNDSATRDICAVLWVANPDETSFFIKVRGGKG
jgi:IMP and pyridine-specific 5'-nucleotidase